MDWLWMAIYHVVHVFALAVGASMALLVAVSIIMWIANAAGIWYPKK